MAAVAQPAKMISHLRVWLTRAGRQTSGLFHRAPARPIAPGFHMNDAWELTMHELNGQLDRNPFAQAVMQLPESRKTLVRRDLLKAEESSVKARRPKQHLRAEIMDAAAMSLYSSHILLLEDPVRLELAEQFGDSFADEELLLLLVTNELRYTVLRTYARFRFNDASESDWFTGYLSVARKLLEARTGSSAKNEKIDDVSGVNPVEYLRLLEKLKSYVIEAPSRRPVDQAGLLRKIS